MDILVENCNLQSLNKKELEQINGGGVPPLLIAGAAIGGAFVLGLAVGALAAWAVYEITH
jgi:lactobin A/cerein 7B family class IIb bacteriocin